MEGQGLGEAGSRQMHTRPGQGQDPSLKTLALGTDLALADSGGLTPTSFQSHGDPTWRGILGTKFFFSMYLQCHIIPCH